MRVKKNISIEDTLRDRALIRAKQLSTDFSGYITFLINKDLGELAITEELPKTNNKVSEAMDSILGM